MADTNDLLILGIDEKASKKRMDSQLKKIINEMGNSKTVSMTLGINIDDSKKKIQSQLQAITKSLSLEVNVKTNYKTAESDAKKHHQQLVDIIDKETKKRSESARQYADDFKKATQEISADYKKQLANDTLANNIKKAQLELTRLKEIYSSIGTDANFSAQYDKLFDQSKTIKFREELANLNSGIGAFKKELSLAEGGADSFGKSIMRVVGYYISFQAALGLVRKALTDMKSIDKELVELSKYTDLVRENFKQASIEAVDAGNKWGKTATDWLQATKIFAQNGAENYKQLGEVALLAQAAGDLTAELASKYLITANAAFQLGNSEEKLTALLDSQNKVTNLNSVSMEAMANATKDYSSIAVTAGESAQTMTALIATAVGATQESGNEVARSLNAISMNIRKIKDVSVDGVIDEDSMAKAEKALDEIGIKTRVLKDGIMELKQPSQVLGELATKFEAGQISAENLSKILSDVAGKEHANTLAAMVKNWDLYSKAMQDFTNANGSAAKEAKKDLESWDSKLNILSNTWVKFVAKTVDTEWIKGGIDGVTALVDTFDNLGNVLVLVGGLFVALKYPAIISGFASMAAVVNNVAFAFQYSATTGTSLSVALKEVGVSASLAQASIAAFTLVLSAGLMIYSHWKQEQEEAKQKAIELSNAINNQLSVLSELRNKIKDESTSRETLVGLMKSHNEKYGEELSAINDVNEARLKAIELLDEEAKARAQETIRETSAEYAKQKNFLEDKYILNSGVGASIPYENPQAYLSQLERMIDSANERIDDLSKLEIIQLENLQKAYNTLKDEIDKAKTVVEGYENAQAVLAGTYDYSTNAITENNNALDESTENIYNHAAVVEQLHKSIDDLQSAYSILTSAQSEYNKTGELSMDTAQSLISLGGEYLEYLTFADGKIRLNTEALDNKTNSLKEEMIASTQAALAEEIRGIVEDDLKTKTDTLSTSTDTAKNKLVEIGKQAIDTANDMTTLAGTIAAVNAAFDGEVDAAGLSEEAMNKINNAIKNAQTRIQSINSIGGGSKSLGSSSGSGGSKSTKDTWKEEFDQKLKAIQYEKEKRILAGEDALKVEVDYLNKLDVLNGEYFKGKSKYLDEYQKYEIEVLKGREKLQKDLFDKEYAELKWQLDRNLISQTEYLNRLEYLNNQYHQNDIELWKKYELEIYQMRKKFLDDYISAREKALQDELKSINKDYDAKIKKLQNQREKESSYYDDLIKAEQEKLSLLNAQYTEEDRLLKIEKARQDLARALSQKTSLVYNGETFEYMADFEAVSQAQNTLADLLKDYQQHQEKLRIEEEVERLRKAKDNTIAIIDESLKRLQDMKVQAAENINEQMEKLEELKQKWGESLDISEDSEFYKGILDQILSDEQDSYVSRISDLTKFVNDWNQLVGKMREPKTASSSMSGGLSKVNSVTTDKYGNQYSSAYYLGSFSDGGFITRTGRSIIDTHGTTVDPELVLNSDGIDNVGAALGIIGSTKSVAQQLDKANSGELDKKKLLEDFLNKDAPFQMVSTSNNPNDLEQLAKINKISKAIFGNANYSFNSFGNSYLNNLTPNRIIPSQIQEMALSKNNSIEKPVNLTIQKIEMHGVNDFDGLRKEIEDGFDNTMLQINFGR